MRLRMLETKKGCNDGLHVRTYEKGEDYEFSEALGGNFLGQGVAEKYETPVAAPEEAEANEDDNPAEDSSATIGGIIGRAMFGAPENK